MRLIDADSLIQKRAHAKQYDPEMYVIGQGYIMDAPTIELIQDKDYGSCIYEDNFTYESPCSHCSKNPKYYDCYQEAEIN
jgi:hypothetical protein